jgi:hypothetical protein
VGERRGLVYAISVPGLFQPDDVRRRGFSCIRTGCSAQECRRDIPLATVVGDDRHGSLVVAREYALNQATIT